MYINDEVSELSVILLTAESKSYDFEGSSGVSHKIRVSVNGEIVVCRSNEEQIKNLKQYEGILGTAVIKIVSRRETISLELVKFVPNA